MSKRLTILVLLLVGMALLVFAGGVEEVDDGTIRVALIGNQRFGDGGPMDNMAAGLERAAELYDVEIKTLESISAGAHEEDVRAMAREGYDLILTTFPPMSQATVAVARDFPDTKFAAIYQFINVDGESIPNIWDTTFQGQETLYMTGVLSALLSDSGRIGLIGGAEEPFINNEMNGFLDGVRATDPGAVVDVAFVGSFEDPAKAKEIALAMISGGVDVFQTLAAKSQLGVLEAAQESGAMFLGDVADNSATYPEGVVGYYGVDFGANVVEAVRQVVEDDWQGGEPGVMSTSNGGYFVPYEAVEAFAERNPEHRAAALDAIAELKDIEAQIIAGEISVPFNPETPAW